MTLFYISRSKLTRIQRLLSEGVPIRAIAKQVEVSRNTVYRVRGVSTGRSMGRETLEDPEVIGEVIRCGCGASVYTAIPCLACRLRTSGRG